MAATKKPARGMMVCRRVVAQGLLATTALASLALPAAAQLRGPAVFARKRPQLPAAPASGALVNPPAIVPKTRGAADYALTMAQQTFAVGTDTVQLYAYSDPNNPRPNPNIVGPTISIPNNARDGFAFSIDLTNNLPLHTGTVNGPAGQGSAGQGSSGHGSGGHGAIVQGTGETPHGFNVTNIHTHGLHVAPPQDNVYVVLCPTGDNTCSAVSAAASGNPQLITATGSIPYAYNVGPSGPSKAPPHPAGTYWYHPHKHGSTAIQVVNGATGALIVRGDLDEVPGVKGLTEQVMVIQQIEYTTPATSASPGVVEPDTLYGNSKATTNAQITINGQVNPTVTMQLGEIQRWRVVNATYSAFLVLQFGAATSGGGTAPSLYAIATDGVPLTNVPGVISVPYPLGMPPTTPATKAEAVLNEIAILAPGQRLDLLAQAPTSGAGGQDGAAFPLVVSFYETQHAVNQTIATVQYSGAKTTPDPMPSGADFSPGKLVRPQFDDAGIVPPPPMIGGRQSTWSINFNFNLGSAGNAAVDVQRGVGTPVNEQFDPNNAQIELDLYDPAKKNTTYWQVTASGALHAFHIHINSFLVAGRSYLGVTGVPPTTFEFLDARIWRDTVRVDPDPSSGTAAGAPAYMVSQQYDYSGWYVMHCHVLDHEDFGMMVSVKVG